MTEARQNKRVEASILHRFVFTGSQGEQRQEGKGKEQTRGNKMTEKAQV